MIAVNLSTDVYGGTVIQHVPRPGPTMLSDNASQESRDSTLRKMLGRENDPGLTTVLVTAFSITQDRLSRPRLAGDPPDITIVPRTPSIGPSSSTVRPRRSRPDASPLSAPCPRSNVRSLFWKRFRPEKGSRHQALGSDGYLPHCLLPAHPVAIALHLGGLIFRLGDPLLDHIADRHDPGELALDHHWQVADAPVRHLVHQREHRVGGRPRAYGS